MEVENVKILAAVNGLLKDVKNRLSSMQTRIKIIEKFVQKESDAHSMFRNSCTEKNDAMKGNWPKH